MMRLTITLAALLFAATATAQESWISNDGCTDRNFRFGGERAHVAEEVIRAGNLSHFKAVMKNAPVSVVGGRGAGYTITVCKAAAHPDDLAAIRVSVEGGELKTVGPAGRDWVTTYSIEVPQGASLELETKNGPISFRDVDGRIVARASNGPLSLKNVSGEVDVTTTNGPISVSGGSGNLKLQATNGPLSVGLDGPYWRGGSLEAETKNGPLTLRVPRGYASGVLVESKGRAPLSCNLPGCEDVRRSLRSDGRWTDDEPRRIELGSGRQAVRLSTVNGPVTIREE